MSLDKLVSGIDSIFKQDTFESVDAEEYMLYTEITQNTAEKLSTCRKVPGDYRTEAF